MTVEAKTSELNETLKIAREVTEKLNEKAAKIDVLDIDKLNRVNAFMDSQEDVKQAQLAVDTKHQNDMLEMTKKLEDGESKLIDLEKAMSRGLVDSKAQSLSQEYDAIKSYMMEGESAFHRNPELKAYLRTDNATLGGQLVPTGMELEITKKITEISPIRNYARVRTMTTKSLEIPSRDTLPTAGYEGEGEESQLSTSTGGQETIVPARLTVTVPTTRDLIMNSPFNIENEISSDVSEAMAQKEGSCFVSGTGFKQPEGIITNADVIAAARDTAANTLTLEDVILMSGDLVSGYNPMYGWNRTTTAYLRTLKSSAGGYLWVAGAENAPNTLNGFAYIELPDLPAHTVDNGYPVIFADLAMGYRIYDRTGIEVIRDEVTRKRNAIIEMTFNRWNTGKVVNAQAIKALKKIA